MGDVGVNGRAFCGQRQQFQVSEWWQQKQQIQRQREKKSSEEIITPSTTL